MAVRAQPNQPQAEPAAENEPKLQYPVGPNAGDYPETVPPLSPDSTSAPAAEPEIDFFRAAFYQSRGIERSDSGEATQPGAGQDQADGGATGGDSSVRTSAESGTAGTGTGQPASGSPKSESGVLTLTPEELARRVQAETDRREAERMRKQQERDRQERLRREREEDARLRQENPYAYARKMEQKEAEEQSRATVHQTATELATSALEGYDASVLAPMLDLLPAEISQRLIQESDPIGIPGRGRLASATLNALREQWMREGAQSARDHLLKDEAFVKEMRIRFGGSSPEVEHFPAEGASSGPVNTEAFMNDAIRAAASGVMNRRRG